MPIPHGIRQAQTVTDENDGKEAVVTEILVLLRPSHQLDD